MPSRETYVQSGDWIKFRDENHWRYAPPFDPRNDARPKRLAPPTNLSNRRGNRGASGKSKAPILNMNSNGDFQVMKYGKGKSLPGYSGLPVVDTRIKMPSRSQMIKALAHLGFSVATKFNPYAQIAYTAADVAYTYYENGWFDNAFGSAPWAVVRDSPAVESGWSAVGGETIPCVVCGAVERAYTTRISVSGCDSAAPVQYCGNVARVSDYPYGPGQDIQLDSFDNCIITARMHRTDPRYVVSTGAFRVPTGSLLRWHDASAGSKVVLPLTVSVPPMPALSESAYNDPVRKQALKKYELPAVEVSSDGGKSPPRITTHVRSKPGRGEREKKGQIDRRLAQRVIAALYDATTEASDFVDIAYDALKKGHKCRGAKSMSDKAWCVYQNIEHIDVTELAYGLVYNHLEDKYIGSIFGKVGKGTKYGTLMYGGYIPSAF